MRKQLTGFRLSSQKGSDQLADVLRYYQGGEDSGPGHRTPGKLIFRVSCECVLLLQLCANYTT